MWVGFPMRLKLPRWRGCSWRVGLALLLLASIAQSEQLPIKHYTTADGLTHTEAGIPSSQARDHALQLDKRARKLEQHDYGRWWADIEGEGDAAVITFGSATAPAREAAARAPDPVRLRGSLGGSRPRNGDGSSHPRLLARGRARARRVSAFGAAREYRRATALECRRGPSLD